MTAEALVVVVNLGILGMFPASLVAWAILIRRRLKHASPGPLVPLVQRPNPFWSPLAFLVLMGCFLIVSPLAQLGLAAAGIIDMPGVVDAEGEAAETRDSSELVLGTSVFVISCALTCGYLYLLAPSRFGEIGLKPIWSGVKLGLIASFLVLPPLMLLMAGVSWLIPYEHKVLNVMADDPSVPKFALLFFATAIITPIVEEFTIRVVLQGSLQGLADRTRVGSLDASELVDTSVPSQEANSTFETERIESAETGTEQAEAISYQENPVAWAYRSSLDDQGRPQPASPVQVDDLRGPASRAAWPIVLTSLLFALLHYGQGLAPVPLFFLSLALGYLYRQTGNITASVVVHMFLNSITMISSFVAMMAADA